MNGFASGSQVSPTRRSCAGSALLCASLFGIILYLRCPTIFIHPRFWGEEASLYFPRIVDQNPLSGIAAVINGNYQLITNIIVLISTKASTQYSAHVTTYLSFALAFLSAWMIANNLLHWGCSLIQAMTACTLYALQPSGYEVFANSTNIQWITSIIALMLCLDMRGETNRTKLIIRLLLLSFCCLTGSPTCIMAPIFIVRAAMRRDRESKTMAIVVSFCAVLQLLIIAEHHSDITRPFVVSMNSVFAWAIQVVWAPLLLPRWIFILGGLSDSRPQPFMLLLIGAAASLFLVFIVQRKVGNAVAVIFALGLFYAPLLNEFGAIQTPDTLVSHWSGGRYFFVGSTSLILMLAIALQPVFWNVAVIPTLGIVLGLVTGIANTRAAWTGSFRQGPSVSQQLYACDPAKLCKVRAWPENASFWVDLRP